MINTSTAQQRENKRTFNKKLLVKGEFQSLGKNLENSAF
jgi:hypothetical protein